MADIKTRDITKGTIKTLDRAASSMHHLKEETIRSRAADIGRGNDGESEGSYAQDTAEHYAGGSAAYAAKAGVEMMLQSREKAGYRSEPLADSLPDDADAVIIPGSHKSPKTANASSDNAEQVQRAFREQGIKTICNRQSRAKMADQEVLRNAEEDRLTDRVKRASAIRSKELAGYRTGRVAKNRRKPLKSDELIQRRRKEYAVKRITEQNTKSSGFQRIFSIIKGSRPDKTARRTGGVLAGVTRGTKAIFGTLSISGAVAVGIIVIMVLFGAASNMTEDGYYIDGTGDTAIVEVARAQLGNVGGDKFWKWYGFKTHVHWCACFVSWCADQCGYIDAGLMPKFAGCDTGVSWYKSHHRWAGGGYTPHPGDIIFFDFERDGVIGHVGIVETCDGKSLTTIEGNYSNACKRASYGVGDRRIAGYGLSVSVSAHASSAIFERAIGWANLVANDDSYHYVHWKSGDSKTQECPVCNKHSKGEYRGWNCIGFAFACWKHGAGINSRCSCGVIDDGTWNRLLSCSSDAEADRIASGRTGVKCKVIRNGGAAIPLSMLRPGDIAALYSGSGYYHTIFYEGNGLYADCTSGRSDNIQSGNTLSSGTRSRIKVAIRYVG